MSTRGRLGLLAGLAVVTLGSACDTTPEYLKEQARRDRLATLGGDTLSPDFHVFHMTCGACHAVPSPGAKPGYLWEAMLSRMKKNAADAGLMPMATEDEAAVLRFLRSHAKDAR